MSKRRKFSAEFKHGAVEQAKQPGVSCAQVARELGIPENLLTRWKRESNSQGPVAFGGSGTPRDEDLARLKRELARVKKERDFLREAATFFAKLPLLQEVDLQHPLQPNRAPAILARLWILRVVRRDDRAQLRPRHHLIHLHQEHVTLRRFAVPLEVGVCSIDRLICLGVIGYEPATSRGFDPGQNQSFLNGAGH